MSRSALCIIFHIKFGSARLCFKIELMILDTMSVTLQILRKQHWPKSNMMILQFMFLFLSTLGSIARVNRFYFWHKAIAYQHNREVMNSLEKASFSDRGIKLVVSGENKSKSFDKVTICLEIALVYGLPACIFDVAGIQFFYSSPLTQPRYGQLAILGLLGCMTEQCIFSLRQNLNRTKQVEFA